MVKTPKPPLQATPIPDLVHCDLCDKMIGCILHPIDGGYYCAKCVEDAKLLAQDYALCVMCAMDFGHSHRLQQHCATVEHKEMLRRRHYGRLTPAEKNELDALEFALKEPSACSDLSKHQISDLAPMVFPSLIDDEELLCEGLPSDGYVSLQSLDDYLSPPLRKLRHEREMAKNPRTFRGGIKLGQAIALARDWAEEEKQLIQRELLRDTSCRVSAETLAALKTIRVFDSSATEELQQEFLDDIFAGDRSYTGKIVVGFDSEEAPVQSCPGVAALCRGPHILQFATHRRTWIYQVTNAQLMLAHVNQSCDEFLPSEAEFRPPLLPAVTRVLTDPNLLLVGFGLEMDREYVRNHLLPDFNVKLSSTLDLSKMFYSPFRHQTDDIAAGPLRYALPCETKRSIGAVEGCARIFRSFYHKPWLLSISNWAQRPLSGAQLLYAAKDALVPLLVHRELCGRQKEGLYEYALEERRRSLAQQNRCEGGQYNDDETHPSGCYGGFIEF